MATKYDSGLPAESASIWGNGQIQSVKAKTFIYDYTKMGGAAGGYILGSLPNNAILLDILGYWTTAPAGGSAYTLGSAESGSEYITDFVSAGTDTHKHGVAQMDTDTRIINTADTDVILTITGTCTAGRFVATFVYYETDVA